MSSRRRRVLRGAVGSVVLTGAVLASAATAFADSGPAPTASAPATAPVTAGPSAPASTPATSAPATSAPATPSPAAPSTSAPGSQAPAPASPSPSATAADHGSSGQGPVTPVRCVVTIDQNIGAGTTALLTMSPSGPSVLFRGSGEDKPLPGLVLNRDQPKLPASAGFQAEILRPYSDNPQLLTNMEGGGHPASVTSFPRLPEGCGTAGAGDGSGQSAVTVKGSAQTSVIPKGGVAAGYEVTGEGDSALPAAGGTTAAALGVTGLAGFAGAVFATLRRRRAAAPTR